METVKTERITSYEGFVDKSVAKTNIFFGKQALYAWVVLGCAWSFYLYEYVLRVSPGVIEKQLMFDFSVTATSVGVISGFYYWAYVPLQVPCGVIADRFGARRVVSLSAFLCVLGCLFFAQSHNVMTAMIGRFLMGAGSACAYICCAKVIAQWFSADRFPILINVSMFMGTIGGSSGALFAVLVDATDWRMAIVIMSAIGGLVCVVAWLFMRDKPQTNLEVSSSNAMHKAKFLDGIRVVASNPQNWLIGMYGCMMYLPLCAFAELWGVPFLTKMYGIDAKTAAAACINVFIGMGLGCIAAAWISNRMKSRTRVMSLSALGTLVCFLVVFFVPHLPFSVMCLFLFVGGLMSGGSVMYFTAAKENTPHQYSATAVGFTNALVMTSALIFQPLLGKLLDLTWNGQKSVEGIPIYSIENYKIAFSAVTVAFVVGWVIMLFVRETYGKETEN